MKLRLFTALAALLAAGMATVQAQRLAVLNDIHVTPGNACDSALRVAVREINAQPFDLVVVNGDLSNEGSDRELANVKSILDSLVHPLAIVPGNHELNWSQSATKTFSDLWGNDRFAVDLDSLIAVGISCGPYMKMGDGRIKSEDLHWLRTVLQQHPGKKVLSFNHYPLLDEDLGNWREYHNALTEFPVVAHINGHYHKYRSYDGGNIPAFMTRALSIDGDYGYSIVEVDKDWLHIYNKVLGQPARPVFAVAVTTGRKPVELPQYTIDVPEGFDVRCVWTDSASIFTRAVADDRNVYFGNSLGQAIAVDKATGRKLWSVPTGASLFSCPAVLEGGKVAFPAATGDIYVVSADGCKVSQLPGKGGPYVADGIVNGRDWYQGGYKRMERRDARSGKLRWSYDSLNNYCQAAPVLDGNDLIFGVWDTNLRCLDARTGRLRWVWNNGKSANMLGPGNVVPVVTDDKVIIVAPDRFMTAIDRKMGRTLWRDKSHRYRESLGHSADGTKVYAKTMDGELVAVDAASAEFKELWTLDLGLGYEHAPCIVLEQNGVVYAGSRSGRITAVDPEAVKVLWQIRPGTGEINGFDVDPADGSVWVTMIDGLVLRIAPAQSK